MTERLYHRGPDDSGYFETDEVSLGVSRLSIIDIAGGHQPMSNEDGTVSVVFNGEIYNHRKIRRNLEAKGHNFRTLSDTEVLVHLWEDFGGDMVLQLRGMFAFAIHDSRHRLVFLARDRFGKKPLYYAAKDTNFWFASELKALFMVPEIQRDLNPPAAGHYLTFFFNPLQESFVKGVYRLPPGCTLTYEIPTRRVTQRHYWDPMVAPKLHLDDSSALVVLEDRLAEAVRVRLESEAPMGVLLSGGVDSSIVTAIAASFVQNLQTFHVLFEGAPSEARFARLVAEHTGSTHHELSVRTDPMADFSEVVKWIDEPVADASVFPTYYICREARRYVTVCLTGLGGDEMFRGYPWLTEKSWLDFWFGVPEPIRDACYQVSDSVGGPLAAVSADLNKYEQLEYGSLDPRRRCIARLEHCPPSFLGPALQRPTPDGTFSTLMNQVKDDSDARDYLTVKSILPGDYLHKDDRLSMASSLELRNPFLDQIFAPLCLRFPTYLKTRHGVSKYILKKFAVRSLGLPPKAVHRRKVGFAIPLERIHREMLPELENLNAEMGFLNRGMLSKITAVEPSHENSGRVFAILMLMQWCKRNDITMSHLAA